MPNFSPFLGLKKPLLTEKYDVIGVTNYNSDAIDINASKVQSALNYTNVVAGTANAITIATDIDTGFMFSVGSVVRGIAVLNNTTSMTVSVDGGSAKPIKALDGSTYVNVEADAFEAGKPFELICQNDGVIGDFFLLAPKGGGLKEFFGDGSDGTIPVLSAVTTAPNGGNVANLWDMNAGTVFTTGTLSSASDQVVFSIDFGKPYLIQNTNFAIAVFSISISTGANRVADLQYSDDGTNWTYCGGTTQLSTTPTTGFLITGHSLPHRYWRLMLKAGGSNCTISCQGMSINGQSGMTQTQYVFRIIEPSTLNGGAVIKQYTTYTLPVGYEHTTQNPCQGLIIYSQGNATVNGIIDMSQKAGLAPNGNTIPMIMSNFKVTDPYGVEMFNKLTTSLRNLKGGSGGNGGYGGGYSGSTGRQTSVGIGGAGRQNLGGFGGGGSGNGQLSGAYQGGIGGSITNAELGGGSQPNNVASYSNVGVSVSGVNGAGGKGGIGTNKGGACFGGGGGGSAQNANGSDGQYSGGFFCLISGGNVNITGTIRANGGTGGNGANATVSNTSGAGGGGGSGGGVIAIFHKGTYTNNGTVQVNGGIGGTGGAGVGTGEAGGTGTSGSAGTILTQQL